LLGLTKEKAEKSSIPRMAEAKGKISEGKKVQLGGFTSWEGRGYSRVKRDFSRRGQFTSEEIYVERGCG